MLNGAEALALGLSDLGLLRVYAAPGGPLLRVQHFLSRHADEDASRGSGPGPFSQRPDVPCQTLSPHLALGLALGDGLLSGRPACALLPPAGLLAAAPGLHQAGLHNEHRSPVLVLEGPEGNAGSGLPDPDLLDTRPALAAAGLPVFDPGSADELYHLLVLAYATSLAGGLPVVLRAGALALADRAAVRTGARPPPGPGRPGTFPTADTPLLCLTAAAFHRQAREARLRRLQAAAAALTSRGSGNESGGGRRGVVLSGALSPRAQLDCASRGLSTLRLALSWPLPEALLRDFLAGLDEVLVLEAGSPFLLQHLQALCHRSGLRTRLRGRPDRAEREAGPGDEDDLAQALAGFAGRDAAPLHAPPGYDYARARDLLTLRPVPDEHGEIDEEPWGLHLARLRRTAPAQANEATARLIAALRRRQGPALPVLVVTASQGAGLQADVQVGRGQVAPVAGSLAGAAPPRDGSRRPQAVALFDGEGEEAEEFLGILDNARAGRDVLHVIVRRSAVPPEERERRAAAARLCALGLEVASADLEDEAGLLRAVDYLMGQGGARVLLCHALADPRSIDSLRGPDSLRG